MFCFSGIPHTLFLDAISRKMCCVLEKNWWPISTEPYKSNVLWRSSLPYQLYVDCWPFCSMKIIECRLLYSQTHEEYASNWQEPLLWNRFTSVFLLYHADYTLHIPTEPRTAPYRSPMSGTLGISPPIAPQLLQITTTLTGTRGLSCQFWMLLRQADSWNMTQICSLL